jgi:transcriptional regulator with XRE-family HTH domain
MTTMAVRQPLSERAITTRGQQMLLDAPESQGEIATACGVSRPAVSQWRMGYAIPSPRCAAILFERLGIPTAAWRTRPITDADVEAEAAAATTRAAEQPGTQPASHQTPADESPHGSSITPVPELPAHASALDHVDSMIKQVTERMNDPRISGREHSQHLDQWRKLMAMRIQAEARAALMEDATVRHHPKWRKLKGLIIDALIPFPAAAKAVEAAIQRAIGDEQQEDEGEA